MGVEFLFPSDLSNSQTYFLVLRSFLRNSLIATASHEVVYVLIYHGFRDAMPLIVKSIEEEWDADALEHSQSTRKFPANCDMNRLFLKYVDRYSTAPVPLSTFRSNGDDQSIGSLASVVSAFDILASLQMLSNSKVVVKQPTYIGIFPVEIACDCSNNPIPSPDSASSIPLNIAKFAHILALSKSLLNQPTVVLGFGFLPEFAALRTPQLANLISMYTK